MTDINMTNIHTGSTYDAYSAPPPPPQYQAPASAAPAAGYYGQQQQPQQQYGAPAPSAPQHQPAFQTYGGPETVTYNPPPPPSAFAPGPASAAPAATAVAATPAFVPASGPAVAPFNGVATETLNPSSIGVVHRQRLDARWPRWKCCVLTFPCAPLGCQFCTIARYFTGDAFCDWCCWESKLAPRAYAAVHENRVEYNYPVTCCCGCCVHDCIEVQYFDKMPSATVRATCCTTFHFCYCCEPCGQIVADAPCDCLNVCCCPCCRTFHPGLIDADAFVAAVSQAKTAFMNKQRVTMIR